MIRSRIALGAEAPVARLAACYADPFEAALAAHREGTSVVGITSCTVPREMLEAAGCVPLVLRRRAGPEPMADAYLERDVFSGRIRGIFEGLVSGDWRWLRAVVIPRTSEQEYKLFLYLREVDREGVRGPLPLVCLYDLLHSRSPDTRAYAIGRTRQLKTDIERFAGHSIRDEALAAAIEQSNAARAATLALNAARTGRPRLRGAEAVALIGASQFLTASAYARLAAEAARAVAGRPALDGPRLIVAGAPPETPALHSLLEDMGAVVVWEEDAGGVMQPGGAIRTGGDPLMAIAEKYQTDTSSARVFPLAAADEPFEAAVRGGVHGVVFHLPPDDYVAGWDYPRRKRFLDERGVPSLVIRDDVAAMSDEARERVRGFVSGLAGGS